MLVRKDFLVADAHVTDTFVQSTAEEGCRCSAPHEFPMITTSVQFKIVPSRRDVVTGGIGTIEAQQKQRLLHHFPSLERYPQLLIFERDVIWSIRREESVRGNSEDDCRLRFLASVD